MNRPNHCPDLERLILMSLMHFADHKEARLQKAMLKLTTDTFYNWNHAELFGMIRECFNKGEPFGIVDMLMLIPVTKSELHESFVWIFDDYNKIFTGTSNFEAYLDRLITLKILRKQMDLVAEIAKQVPEIADPNAAQECLIEHINLISNLSFRESKDGIDNMVLAEQYYDGELPDDIIIPTTCDQLNQHLRGGVRTKSLITVAGASGRGKTGFAIWLMDVIARNQLGKQCLFFSLEMEARHIWERHNSICGEKLFENMDDEEKRHAIGKAVLVPVKIYDSSMTRMASDIDFIQTTCRLKAMEKPLAVIVVDYLGMVQNRGKFERNDLKQGDIVTKLSELSMELNCVVIALSQINRAASGRAKDDQCPYPSDAADSSASERSSTLWLGIDRPEVYQDDPSYRNQFIVKCRKNRFGGTFEIIFAFNEGTFAEVSHNHFRKPLVQSRNPEQSVFSGRSEDFYANQ